MWCKNPDSRERSQFKLTIVHVNGSGNTLKEKICLQLTN